MIAFPAGVRVWIAGGVTDMRCGMNSLALKVQQGLGRDPHGGEVFCFRGRKGDLIKLLWHDGVGMSLYVKRLEAGKFIWPGLCCAIWDEVGSVPFPDIFSACERSRACRVM